MENFVTIKIRKEYRDMLKEYSKTLRVAWANITTPTEGRKPYKKNTNTNKIP